MTGRNFVVMACLASTALACRVDDQRTDTADPGSAFARREDWSPEAVVHLDSGNAAVRVDSFDVARGHFLVVTEHEPDIAAGWFGLYLAEQGRGDDEAASRALERARELAGESLIRSGRGDPR
jgi:uncharacterized membrane-anchored protein